MEPGKLKLGATDNNTQAEKSKARLNWLYQAVVAKDWGVAAAPASKTWPLIVYRIYTYMSLRHAALTHQATTCAPIYKRRLYTNVIVE